MEKIFGCTVQSLDRNMSSKEVTQLYHRSVADGKQNGYTPVVVFVDDTLEDAIEIAIEGVEVENTEEYVNYVLSNDHTNGKELLDKWYAELKDSYGDELDIDSESLDQWLSVQANAYESSLLPAVSSREGKAYLLQVPTKNPYEIFAWIPFGGWNECPNADEMIAICKYWYDNYGAIPSAITYDTLSFYLENPIKRNMSLKKYPEYLFKRGCIK